MEHTIKIQKHYLIFRDDAKKIFEDIQQEFPDGLPEHIYVDCSAVKFMSRSFVDEFVNIISRLEEELIAMDLLNLDPKLSEFIAAVKLKKERIEQEMKLYR